MFHLLGTVQKKIIRIERMKIHRISPPANRNLHPANRVKNMKKLRRNSPFAGLKVNPWTRLGAQTNQEADEKHKTNKYVQVCLKRVMHCS